MCVLVHINILSSFIIHAQKILPSVFRNDLRINFVQGKRTNAIMIRFGITNLQYNSFQTIMYEHINTHIFIVRFPAITVRTQTYHIIRLEKIKTKKNTVTSIVRRYRYDGKR
jgi:hypothetical protein